MSPKWVPWVEKIVVGREFMIGLQKFDPLLLDFTNKSQEK
jgi:hypothetical protein